MGNPLVRFWRGAWWQLGDRKLPCLPDEFRRGAGPIVLQASLPALFREEGFAL
jgi:hypothetical protein